MLEIAHDIALYLHKFNVIDARTMRDFDVKCLSPVKHYVPRQILPEKQSVNYVIHKITQKNIFT
ncbi:MAG: hypothetical protein JSS53_02955 [Proteobacteria bacterium]|nr:hypothetical protein [Pseudomonadota bacterium]